MVTMREVAARAGVSITTVSFVVNGTKRVSPETADRILTAMKELGYQRNALARALASNRTRIIALVYPDDDGIGDRLSALESVTAAAVAARARGYDVVVWPILGGEDDADGELDALLGGGLVDGVILADLAPDDPRIRLAAHDVPTELLGRPTGRAPSVGVDTVGAMDAALDHLRSLGHDHIAFVGERVHAVDDSPPSPPSPMLDAYVAAMGSRGLPPTTMSCAAGSEGGRQAARHVLAHHPDTTAILVDNDAATFGLLEGLSQGGFPVPSAMSVVSLLTSRALGALASPALTSVIAPTAALAAAAVSALLDRLESRAETTTRHPVPCRFVRGASTGPAREPLR